MLRAGTLRNRIIIFKNTQSKNKIGQVVNDWQPYVQLWANFTPLSVNAVINAQATQNETIAKCVIRYRKDINSGMRLMYQNQMYVINGQPLADPNTGKEYLTLMLKTF